MEELRDVIQKVAAFALEKINPVDGAIAVGNNDQLALALHSITELAKSSPFQELANLASVRAALDDPDHECNVLSYSFSSNSSATV